jgi:hypothetical protein
MNDTAPSTAAAADPVLSPLVDLMRRRLVKFLVQKAIFCPVTGSVLDVRTCVVILDKDNDPAAVLSQQGWQIFLGYPERLAALAAAEMAVDPSTVKA